MVECPVCLRDIEIDDDAREGDVIQCPYCKIWFRLVREGSEWVGEKV
jgi:uncharacterized protein YbaR (Trm112 family)